MKTSNIAACIVGAVGTMILQHGFGIPFPKSTAILGICFALCAIPMFFIAHDMRMEERAKWTP